MFKQFISSVDGSQVYLITSFGIFLLFFIVVSIMLFLMKKDYIKHMSEMPFESETHKADNQETEYNETHF